MEIQIQLITLWSNLNFTQTQLDAYVASNGAAADTGAADAEAATDAEAAADTAADATNAG